MNIHEYQAKELLKAYGVPIPPGEVVYTERAAGRVAEEIGGTSWVVKAQVHAGGRGKAGGVRLAGSLERLRELTDQMIGSRLVTEQTGSDGQPINRVLVERAAKIDREFYLGMIVDRVSQRIVVIASAEGGVDVEEVAAEHPERIHKEVVDPASACWTSSAARSRSRSGSRTERRPSPGCSNGCTGCSVTRTACCSRSTRSSSPRRAT
jgi:succinyl-CoA synthetase beta subunit/malate-CoA ligase subunit beta